MTGRYTRSTHLSDFEVLFLRKNWIFFGWENEIFSFIPKKTFLSSLSKKIFIVQHWQMERRVKRREKVIVVVGEMWISKSDKTLEKYMIVNCCCRCWFCCSMLLLLLLVVVPILWLLFSGFYHCLHHFLTSDLAFKY